MNECLIHPQNIPQLSMPQLETSSCFWRQLTWHGITLESSYLSCVFSSDLGQQQPYRYSLQGMELEYPNRMLSLVATHMCMRICVRIPCNWKETRPAIITSPNITQDSSIRLFLSVGKNAPQHTCNIWLRLESFFFIVLVPRKICCISSSSCFVTLKRFLMFLFLTWEFPHLWLLQM